MNKTLMERERSMLSGVGLGQEFLAEVVDTACYLVNRSPSSALEDKTPQEVYVKTREEALDNCEVGFRYLHGTSDYGLCYQGRSGLDRMLDIRGFVDADWARDLDQRRSTSGYVFNLFGGAINWMTKKQFTVALSTIEAEYMAATHASKEAV
eukprot:PITA_22377